MAANIADINVIAENIAKQRSLPISKWVTKFTSIWEVNAPTPTEGEPIVMNLFKAMINSVLSKKLVLYFDNVFVNNSVEKLMIS